jgi:formylglycine-generating enzyme
MDSSRQPADVVVRHGEDMVRLPAGQFKMGSTGFYPEEAPIREVDVNAFAIDRSRHR